MMNVKGERLSADVGIVVGRFQVHQLHEAHLDVINTVCSRHDRVIIFVGLSPLRNTPTNPLDFNTRKRMILESFPNIEVYYIEDNASDEIWSKNLDRQIDKWLKPYQTAILYGSRDSFISHYHGKYKTQELEATKYISGTELRRRIANSFPPTPEFRAGIIAASLDRYETCYPCVDIAIMDRTKFQVLMGQKEGEQLLRFVGGFASPTSPNYETDARREVAEETGVEIDNLQYIGSTIINDWRYRSETDKIKTLFFVADYIFGRPQADDDIAYVQWVPIADFMNGTVQIMPEHKVLANMLVNYISKNITLPDSR